MTQETANKLLKACSELIEMVDYAHPKFNWGTSHLDAKAIFLLSNAPVLARRAIIQAEQEQQKRDIAIVPLRLTIALCDALEASQSLAVKMAEALVKNSVDTEDYAQSHYCRSCREYSSFKDTFESQSAHQKDCIVAEAIAFLAEQEQINKESEIAQ